jgi:hypothetical protein
VRARPWPAGRPAPKLGDALAAPRKAARHAFVVLDGTLIPIDRVAADRPFYSGKHRLLWAPIAVGTVAIAWLRQPRTPRLGQPRIGHSDSESLCPGTPPAPARDERPIEERAPQPRLG